MCCKRKRRDSSMNLLPFQQILFLVSLSWLLELVCPECTTDSDTERQTLKLLEPLDKIVTVKDDSKNYTYKIGFCVDVNGNNAGVEQTELDGKNHTIGKLSNTHIKQGTDWMILTYKDGDDYGHRCNFESRQAHIVIICNPDSVDVKNARVIEENNEKEKDCYYLFEVESKVACKNGSTGSAGISLGWVIVILVLVVAGTYLIVGFLYQRFVQQAKGREQIPNLEFWIKFGALAADGCNFVCRCNRPEEVRSYKGLGDDQLGMDEDEERDENLLPMY